MEDDNLHTGDNSPPAPERMEQKDVAKSETTGQPMEHFSRKQPLYLPLIDGHIIRLIELEPGEPGDQVHLRLLIAELEYAPEYEALSYVWGDTQNTTQIICNGRPLEVTRNLHTALVRL